MNELENLKEMISFFLPEGLLDYFDLVNIKKLDWRLSIKLQEKDNIPEIPEELRGRKITSKWYKDFLVEDFPIRGRRTTLHLRRRVWKIEWVKKLLKRDIPVTFPSTKLNKEFADFLKGADRARANRYS